MGWETDPALPVGREGAHAPSGNGEACRESLAAFEAIRTGDGEQDARAVYMSGLVAERCGNEDGAREDAERPAYTR